MQNSFLVSLFTFMLFASSCTKYGDTAYLEVENRTSCDYNIFDLITANANSAPIMVIKANETRTFKVDLHCDKCSARLLSFEFNADNCSMSGDITTYELLFTPDNTSHLILE